MLALALAAAVAQPQPGELKTFGDWTVGCDNTRACRAVALVPNDAGRDEYLLLVVDRDGAPAAPPMLSFSAGRDLPKGGAALRVDGKLVGRATGEPLPFTRALASTLANGRRATLTDPSGRPLASASLAGVAAAFLYMDERQGRLGTHGALRRTGRKPDAAIPSPSLPRIVQPAPSARPPRNLAPARAAELIGPDNARCDYAQGPVEPRAHRLDARHSLVIIRHPCGNGAYNIMSSVFVIDEAGRATPARFDVRTGMSPEGDGPLVNADWDRRPRRLTSFAKGRGLGDCGVSQSFAWDGARFRLAEQSEMGECRGSADYITTWRAAVVTR